MFFFYYDITMTIPWVKPPMRVSTLSLTLFCIHAAPLESPGQLSSQNVKLEQQGGRVGGGERGQTETHPALEPDSPCVFSENNWSRMPWGNFKFVFE